jgi:hypothetical protein
MRDIFILKEIWAQHKTYFGRQFAWMTYFTYHLVPAMAPNYKQYILYWAELSKVMLFIT